MLISEKNLLHLIRHKQKLKEGKEERKFRQKLRQEKRAALKNADSPEERKRIRKVFKSKRKEARDSDYFEAADTGETLDELLNLQIRDSAYIYVVKKVKKIMPDINKIEQSYRGARLIATLKSRKEKRFTIGQLKRFIKMGLIATREGDYREASDNFCAAFVLIKSPRTQDEEKVVGITANVKNTLYELCKAYERGVFSRKEEEEESKRGKREASNNKQCVMDIQKNLNTLNANSKTVEKLSIDGKWGSKTSASWRAAVSSYVVNGDMYNEIQVTDEILKNVLNSWPTAAKQLAYDEDVCGARDFIDDVIIKANKEGRGPKEDDPVIDEDIVAWEKSRNMGKSYVWDDLPIREALTVGGGISVNYLYTPQEFKTQYKPTTNFTSGRKPLFKYIVDFGAEKGIEVFDFAHDRDVARHPEGPSQNGPTETALYYEAESKMLLIDAFGNDQIIKDIVVYNNKIYHKDFTPDIYTPKEEHQINDGVNDPNSEEGVQQDNNQTQGISEMLLKEQQLKRLIKQLLFEQDDLPRRQLSRSETKPMPRDMAADYQKMLASLEDMESGNFNPEDTNTPEDALATVGMNSEQLQTVLAGAGSYLADFAEQLYDSYGDVEYGVDPKTMRKFKKFIKRKSEEKRERRGLKKAEEKYRNELRKASRDLEPNKKAEINILLKNAVLLMNAGQNKPAADQLRKLVALLERGESAESKTSGSVKKASRIINSIIQVLDSDIETQTDDLEILVDEIAGGDVENIKAASSKSDSAQTSRPSTPEATNIAQFQNPDRNLPVVVDYKYSTSEAMRIIRAQLNQINGQVNNPLEPLPGTGKWNADVTEHWENALRVHSDYLRITDADVTLPWGQLSKKVQYPSTKEGAIALLDDIGGLGAGEPRSQSGGGKSSGGRTSGGKTSGGKTSGGKNSDWASLRSKSPENKKGYYDLNVYLVDGLQNGTLSIDDVYTLEEYKLSTPFDLTGIKSVKSTPQSVADALGGESLVFPADTGYKPAEKLGEKISTSLIYDAATNILVIDAIGAMNYTIFNVHLTSDKKNLIYKGT